MRAPECELIRLQKYTLRPCHVNSPTTCIWTRIIGDVRGEHTRTARNRETGSGILFLKCMCVYLFNRT